MSSPADVEQHAAAAGAALGQPGVVLGELDLDGRADGRARQKFGAVHVCDRSLCQNGAFELKCARHPHRRVQVCD